MLKKILVLLSIFIFINPCFAFKWEDRINGEKPYGVFVVKVLPIESNVKKLSLEEKKEYLKKIYQTRAVYYDKNNKIFSIELLKSEEPITYYLGKIFYDKDLNLLVVDDRNIHISSLRFQKVYSEEKEKYGLYDFKRKRFSGFKYEKIEDSFSGVPVVVNGNKRQSVQPFKNVGISMVKYPVLVFYTLIYYSYFGVVYLIFEH